MCLSVCLSAAVNPVEEYEEHYEFGGEYQEAFERDIGIRAAGGRTSAPDGRRHTAATTAPQQVGSKGGMRYTLMDFRF